MPCPQGLEPTVEQRIEVHKHRIKVAEEIAIKDKCTHPWDSLELIDCEMNWDGTNPPVASLKFRCKLCECVVGTYYRHYMNKAEKWMNYY